MQVKWLRKVRAEVCGLEGKATVKSSDTAVLKFEPHSEDIFEFEKDRLRVYSLANATHTSPDGKQQKLLLDFEYFFFRDTVQSVYRQYSSLHNAHVLTICQPPLNYEAYFSDLYEASEFTDQIARWKCRGTL